MPYLLGFAVPLHHVAEIGSNPRGRQMPEARGRGRRPTLIGLGRKGFFAVTELLYALRL